MIKALIIDDEQHSINAITNLLSHHRNYEICGTAKTIKEAVKLTQFLNPDLVFLDIVLGDETGFDYLTSLAENINFDIIFITGYNNFAIKAFEFSALHYLLKPIGKEDFDVALSRMNYKVSQKEKYQRLLSLEYNLEDSGGYKFIHLSTMDSYHKISTKDILYLQSDSNYTNFQLTGKRKITTSKTLKYYFNLLKESHFFKVSKSYVVNIEQIKTYKKRSKELVMSDNTIIPVAVRRQKDFVKAVFVNKGV